MTSQGLTEIDWHKLAGVRRGRLVHNTSSFLFLACSKQEIRGDLGYYFEFFFVFLFYYLTGKNLRFVQTKVLSWLQQDLQNYVFSNFSTDFQANLSWNYMKSKN